MAEEDLEMKICYPTEIPMLLESTNNRLSGVFSSYVGPYFEMLKQTFNSSIIVLEENPGIGQEVNEDGVYDGCLGKLQRGEADLMANTIDYPLNIVNVSQGFIAFDEQISFAGAFARPESVKKADFMRSIYAFHWSVYMLVSIYLLAFSVILRVRSSLKRNSIMTMAQYKAKRRSMELAREQVKQRLKSDPGLVDVLRNFVRTNFLVPKSFTFSVLIIFLNLFSFFFFTYFNSLLNTDLVIPGKAKLFEDYEQIMKHGVKPIFFTDSSYYGDLKYAKNGSKGHEFWNWAVNKFGGEEKLNIKANIDEVIKNLPSILAGNMLLFTGDIIALSIRSTMCELFDRKFSRLKFLLQTLNPKPFDWDKYQDSQMYTRKDPSAPNKIKSIIIGKRFLENAKLFALAKKLFLRYFEHGHFHANINMLINAKVSTQIPGFKSLLGPAVPERSQIRQRCKECNVPVPKIPDINYLTLSNFTFSFSLCAGLIICSFVLFYVEILSGRAMKARAEFLTKFTGQILFLPK